MKNWTDYWGQDQFWSQSKLWKINAQLFFERMTPLVNLRPDDTVLDIGCGPGFLETVLAPHVAKIHATDTSEPFVQLCRKNCQGIRNVEASRLPQDYTDLSACGSGYSLILCVSTLQYYRDIAEVQKIIASAQKIARPGGRMLIADIPLSRNPLQYLIDAGASILQSFTEGYFFTLAQTVYALLRKGKPYRQFAKTNQSLTFTKEQLEAMVGVLGLKSQWIRRSLSVYANRPSILIEF